MTKTALPATDLVAWSPSQPRLLATTADRGISFLAHGVVNVLHG